MGTPRISKQEINRQAIEAINNKLAEQDNKMNDRFDRLFSMMEQQKAVQANSILDQAQAIQQTHQEVVTPIPQNVVDPWAAQQPAPIQPPPTVMSVDQLLNLTPQQSAQGIIPQAIQQQLPPIGPSIPAPQPQAIQPQQTALPRPYGDAGPAVIPGGLPGLKALMEARQAAIQPHPAQTLGIQPQQPTGPAYSRSERGSQGTPGGGNCPCCNQRQRKGVRIDGSKVIKVNPTSGGYYNSTNDSVANGMGKAWFRNIGTLLMMVEGKPQAVSGTWVLSQLEQKNDRGRETSTMAFLCGEKGGMHPVVSWPNGAPGRRETDDEVVGGSVDRMVNYLTQRGYKVAR